MAHISRFLWWRHLRSEPTFHVLHYRDGQLLLEGRGLSYWFLPLWSSIAEVPCDDRDQPFLFHGRSLDFQDVTAQGTITYRVADPQRIAARVDFSINPHTGTYQQTPLEQISELLAQLAQQVAWEYFTRTPLRQILVEGVNEIRERIRTGLLSDSGLAAIGLEIVSVRISGIAPTADVEKALQAPTYEAIQQTSDEATFQRRAMAVEKERAIAENELHNRIELARREEQLIAQQGQNKRHQARETAEARQIQAEAKAQRQRLEAATEAEGIRNVEQARVESEQQRMEIYRNLPSAVLYGLAAQELAGNFHRIDHLSIAGDSIAPLLGNLVQAATRRLEQDGEEARE